jgi:hypothetical protein
MRIFCQRLRNFKGSIQSIHNWEPQLNHEKLSEIERSEMLNDLYGTVTGLPLYQKPGRREPKSLKSSMLLYLFFRVDFVNIESDI